MDLKVQVMNIECRRMNAGIEDLFKMESQRISVEQQPAAKSKKITDCITDTESESTISESDADMFSSDQEETADVSQ
ncbi:hypothetical protein X975_14497, partial [Stegodyphus mimosarum]